MSSQGKPNQRFAGVRRDPAFDTLVELLVYRGEQQRDDLAYEFHDHTPSLPAELAKQRLTYGELLTQAKAVATLLQARSLRGQPVLLLFKAGLDFLRAYYGCLMAGAIGTPLRPPLTPSEQRQALAICSDSKATLVLTSSALVAPLRKLFESSAAHVSVLAVDQIDWREAEHWSVPPVGREDLALIQYTSGSTGRPKGVMVSHGNLLANEATIYEAFGHDRNTIVAGWLPMFHDMGLIGNVLQPLYIGVPSVLMDPMAFVQKPVRWLQMISAAKATTSGGPNFAYELCLRRIDSDEIAGLDLSSWSLAFNGAEPVRMEIIRKFATTFSAAGFRKEAFYPCYGLAECTLFVTGVEKRDQPVAVAVDRAAVGKGQVVDVSPDAEQVVELVCCGRARGEQQVRIVDPESRRPCGENEIGEVWLDGPSKAQGYLYQPDLTHELFAARLADDDGRGYLRTGDLGFLRDGQLYISGRIKDLIIVRGKNHYPQDIEATVAVAHLSFRAGCAAAFSVDGDGEESLVLVQEVKPVALRSDDIPQLLETIRAAVVREHGLHLHDLVLVGPSTVPKTSSGKLQRQLCKALYESGSLKRIQPRVLEGGV